MREEVLALGQVIHGAAEDDKRLLSVLGILGSLLAALRAVECLRGSRRSVDCRRRDHQAGHAALREVERGDIGSHLNHAAPDAELLVVVVLGCAGEEGLLQTLDGHVVNQNLALHPLPGSLGRRGNHRTFQSGGVDGGILLLPSHDVAGDDIQAVRNHDALRDGVLAAVGQVDADVLHHLHLGQRLVQCCTDVARGDGYLHVLRNDNPARVTYLGLVLCALVGQREVAFLGILELHNALDAVLDLVIGALDRLCAADIGTAPVECVAVHIPRSLLRVAGTGQTLEELSVLAAVDNNVVLDDERHILLVLLSQRHHVVAVGDVVERGVGNLEGLRLVLAELSRLLAGLRAEEAAVLADLRIGIDGRVVH